MVESEVSRRRRPFLRCVDGVARPLRRCKSARTSSSPAAVDVSAPRKRPTWAMGRVVLERCIEHAYHGKGFGRGVHSNGVVPCWGATIRRLELSLVRQLAHAAASQTFGA